MSKGQSFKRIYPSQEAITFDGGLDNKFPRALLPDNESPDCANVIFSDGAVSSRDGLVKLNAVAAGSNPFDGFYTRRANDLSETMVCFIDGHMKYLNATTFITIPSAQSVFTIGSRVACDMAENYLFIGNGGAGPYKWDGSYFTQHGVSAPTATATVASINTAVGSLTTNGAYQYKYTWVNSALVEGNVSPASTTFVVSGTGQNTISNIGVAPASAGVAYRYLYRNKAADPTTFYRVTKILDNTTTTYNDNVADASLGAAAPTDNGLPPKYSAIHYHRNILFVNDTVNKNLVWYSNVGSPYTFPSSNFFKVGDNTSDLVIGFASYDNHLIVFCERSIWMNYMTNPADPTTWRQLPVNSPYGSKSPYSFVTINLSPDQVILFPAAQNSKFVGFAALSGIALDPTSTSQMNITSAGSDLQSQRIEPDMFQVQEGYQGNISGIVYKNKAYVTLTFGSGQTQNNRVYVCDFSLSNLRKEQKISWVPFTGMNIAQMTIYGGKLYGASSNSNGTVYQITDTGVYSDNGSAIDAYYWTKEYPGFEPDLNYYKDFRYANVLVDNYGKYYMNVRYKADSDTGNGTAVQLNLDPGGSLWGIMTWGVDTWGAKAAQSESRIFLGSTRGKRIQFRFDNQNTAGNRFRVQRMNFAYNLRGYR